MEQEFVAGAGQLEKAGTPLRKFWGDFEGWEVKEEFGRRAVYLNFVGMEVLELIPGVVFEHPVAQIRIPYSKRDRSGWGKFLTSIEERGHPLFTDLLKKRVLMDGHMEQYGEDDEGKPIAGLVWNVTEIAGESKDGAKSTASSKDPMTQVLDILHGKTGQDFAEAVLKTPVGKERSASIYDQSLIGGLIEAGTVVLEGDVYWVVDRERETAYD